ncbi:hypothetical protein D7X96_21915 [Corallococcus interemptor]|uniref:Uncharacterized protein n=1 Tax=Corallococcus interemptor TaxID=2316720 RepID=A0A3A8QCG2_9BACT|nr:hypothetical protein [Corallococcus interemptor]RKH66306.1 hypothetical protein D7X96_21915 [Corallococcus interemptor]
MRRLLFVAPLFSLVGCSYLGIASPPGTRLGSTSGTQPVSIRVGKTESEPLKTPEAEESSTAEASDDPGATQ